MNKITTIDLNRKNASFMAIYTKDYQPFLKMLELSKEARETKCIAVLMLNRWDGGVGFVGGNVDAEETILEASIRETKEEINYEVTETPNLVVSHRFQAGRNTLDTHLHSIEVSNEKILEIQKNISNGVDFGSEIMGTNLIMLADLGRGKGLPKFLNSPMATSVKEELAELCVELLGYTETEKMFSVAKLDLSNFILEVK